MIGWESPGTITLCRAHAGPQTPQRPATRAGAKVIKHHPYKSPPILGRHSWCACAMCAAEGTQKCLNCAGEGLDLVS